MDFVKCLLLLSLILTLHTCQTEHDSKEEMDDPMNGVFEVLDDHSASNLDNSTEYDTLNAENELALSVESDDGDGGNETEGEEEEYYEETNEEGGSGTNNSTEEEDENVVKDGKKFSGEKESGNAETCLTTRFIYESGMVITNHDIGYVRDGENRLRKTSRRACNWLLVYDNAVKVTFSEFKLDCSKEYLRLPSGEKTCNLTRKCEIYYKAAFSTCIAKRNSECRAVKMNHNGALRFTYHSMVPRRIYRGKFRILYERLRCTKGYRTRWRNRKTNKSKYRDLKGSSATGATNLVIVVPLVMVIVILWTIVISVIIIRYTLKRRRGSTSSQSSDETFDYSTIDMSLAYDENGVLDEKKLQKLKREQAKKETSYLLFGMASLKDQKKKKKRNVKKEAVDGKTGGTEDSKDKKEQK